MRVTAIGSGDAFCAAGRGHTSWLIEDPHGACAVDFGATALQQLKARGFEPQRIAAVHFTHLHGDHIGGWPFLLVDAVYRARRAAPLSVTGPQGTRDRLETLWAACYADAAQKALPFPIDYVELRPGASAEVAGRRVAALRAQHMRPPHVALMLRIATSGRVLAFTGDTGVHDGIAALALGADLLCAECTDLEPVVPPPGEEPQERGRRHLSWRELRELLPHLGSAKVLLAHLGEVPRAARTQIEEEARAARLDVRVCDDGDGLDVA